MKKSAKQVMKEIIYTFLCSYYVWGFLILVGIIWCIFQDSFKLKFAFAFATIFALALFVGTIYCILIDRKDVRKKDEAN